jgi:flagellar motor protein MotB
MIMKLATITIVSTLTYNGGNVPISSAVSQQPDGSLSFGIRLKGDHEYFATTLAAVRPPTSGLPAKSDDQVGPYLYKVRDDHPASNKDVGLVPVSKAGEEKEPLGQLQQQLLAKEKELVILRGKTAAATDLLSFEKQRAGVLETQVAQQEQELRALRSRGQTHDQLSHELVFTRSHLDQARQKIFDLERQLATSNLEYAKQRIAELDRQVDAKDKEIIAMRTDSDSKEKLKEKLKDDLASRTEELKKAEQHNLGLEHQLLQARETTDKVDRRLSDLESQLTTRNAQLEKANQLLANLQQSEAKEQEVPLSQAFAAADKKPPRSASIESGQPTTNSEQSNLTHSDEAESSGGDLAKLNDDLSNELRPELIGRGVLLRQVGNNKLSLELATGDLYAPGQAVLTQGGSSLLRRIGTVLQKFRYQTIEVAGHTDSKPLRNGVRKTFQDNSKLSWARAQQASRSLISGGLQADRVKAVGYAATKPIANNDTEQGRSKNRRIEVIITQWSEPDDNSGNTTTRISSKRQLFSAHKVVHR